jgi:hypothetical protein
MTTGEQFIDKINKRVLQILQKHFDSWSRKQLATGFRLNPHFQDINQFILYWHENRISVKKLSTIPGSLQGNMVYILQVLNHHSHLS